MELSFPQRTRTYHFRDCDITFYAVDSVEVDRYGQHYLYCRNSTADGAGTYHIVAPGWFTVDYEADGAEV